MDTAVALATSPVAPRYAGGVFAPAGDAFLAYVIGIAIVVAVFALIQGAGDRRRIKVSRKG